MTGPAATLQEGCRLCGEPLGSVLKRFGPLPVAGSYVQQDTPRTEALIPFTLMRCEACGLVQLQESLTADFYKDYRFIGGTSTSYKDHLQAIAVRVAGCLRAGATVLEIGPGDGTLLEMLRSAGMQVGGFEPAIEPARAACAKKLEVRNEPFGRDTARASPIQAADLVIIRHVLEHIDDFGTIFEGLERVTGSDTILLVEVPDLTSTLDGRLYSSFYHAHPCYFSIETLTRLLSRFGWRITAAGIVDIFGGSILASAKRSGVASGAEREMTFGPDPKKATPGSLEAFLRNWQQTLDELRRFLEGLLRESLVVAGYGADERTTSVIGTAGLTPRHVRCLYDKNRALHLLAIPGARVPIRDPARLLEDRPDVLVIFAQSHEEAIITEQERYRETGGRFVTLRTRPPSFVGGS